MLLLSTKNRKYLASVVVAALLIILFIVIIYFLQNYKNSRKTLSESLKPSTTFPIITDESQLNFYSFSCKIGNIKDENVQYEFTQKKFGTIFIRLTAECTYLDKNDDQQKIVVILGALIENDEGFFFSYGDRSFPLPIDNPEQYSGKILKQRIEKHTNDNNKFDKNVVIDDQDFFRVIYALNDNKMLEENINDLGHNSERVYYASGFTKSWDNESIGLFTETGDPQYLPSLPDGRKFIPAIRLVYESDN